MKPAPSPSAPDGATVDRSITKPHLSRLSGVVGGNGGGFVLERVIEKADATHLHDIGGPSGHVLVIPTGPSATLDWKMDGRNRSARFAPGELLLNPKGNFVAPRWKEDTEFILLALDPSFLEILASENGLPASSLPPHFQFKDPGIHRFTTALAANLENAPPDPLLIDSFARNLSLHLLLKYGGHPAKIPRGRLPFQTFQALTEYIDHHLENEIRLDELAAIAGMSPSHFLAIFRRTAGIPPHRFVVSRRLSKAKSLLVSGRLPLAEIALCCGFSDQSHMTRMFRKTTGLTPLMIRRS